MVHIMYNLISFLVGHFSGECLHLSILMIMLTIMLTQNVSVRMDSACQAFRDRGVHLSGGE